MAYDLRGAPTSKTDALNRTTLLEFDAAGNIIKVTDPLGNSTQMRYNANNMQTHLVSPMGSTQINVYDDRKRLVEVLAPGEVKGKGSRIAYDINGWPIKSISPSGLTTEKTYDQRGRLKISKDSAGNTIAYEYGADDTEQAGLLVSIQFPTYKENYKYDLHGQLTTVIQHLSEGEIHSKHQTYNALGQIVSNIDNAGRASVIEYDALGRQVQSIDSLGGVTKQKWSAFDQVVVITDANGNSHDFMYDKTGAIVKETRPMGNSIYYEYHAEGQLSKRVDAASNERVYTYNLADNLIIEQHKLKNGKIDQSIDYVYNSDGQVISYEQVDESRKLISKARYVKDVRGRTTKSQISYGKVDGDGSLDFEVGQNFNQDGQISGYTYPEGSTSSVNYVNGLLANVTLPNESVIAFESYRWNMPMIITSPKITRRVLLDDLQRIKSIDVNNGSEVLEHRSYSYDASGNINELKNKLGNLKYRYDYLNRLIEILPDMQFQNNGLLAEKYSYDSVNNIRENSSNPGVWSYDNNNQLVSFPDGSSSLNGEDLSQSVLEYTLQGHTSKEISKKGEVIYGYNGAERLVDYEFINGKNSELNLQASYRYDPMGRRISKKVTKDGGASVVYFFYGNSGLMGELNERGEIEKAYGYNPIATQQGLWSTDPIWQAEVKSVAKGTAYLASDNHTDYHYLQTDHLRTPFLSTDENGEVSWRAISDGFGALKIFDSNITMNLRNPGQYFDVESGLYYNFNRDYNPEVGRYIQADPMLIKAGVNFYAYANANAVSYFDDLGLKTVVRGPQIVFHKPGASGEVCGRTAPRYDCPQGNQDWRENPVAMAITILDKLDYSVICKENCGKYSIDGLVVDIAIGVHFKSRGSMPGKCNYDVFRKFEQDHVNDLKKWSGTVKGLGDSFIASNSGNLYSSSKECEQDNSEKFYGVLWPTLSKAAQQSQLTWDASGAHSCSP